MNDVAITTAGLVSEAAWFDGCRVFVLKVLEKLGIDNWEVSILFCDDSFIAELNARYRGIAAPTDVLSFSQAGGEASPSPGEERRVLAGDIIISLAAMRRNAETAAVSENEEIKRLLVHGLLHLKGMDHEEASSDMLNRQENLLREFSKEKIV
jgi:probable rRNA maturation factor